MQIEKDRRPVAMQLVRQIQRLMAEQGLKPGDKVPPQRELAITFGASRPTVREAVLQLEAMGLIRVEPARGAFVTEAFGRPAVDLSEWSFAERFSQSEVYQLRFALEGSTSRLAARNASEGDLERLRVLNEAMREAILAGRYRDAMDNDFNFHLTIADIAGNRVIRDILALYRPIITQTQRPPISAPERLGEAYREHAAILRALGRRDGETSAVAMCQHIVQSTDRMNVTFMVG